jgi:DNA polymerase II
MMQDSQTNHILGFLLTRQWREHSDGMQLRYWFHTAQGAVLIEMNAQEGLFFVEDRHFNTAINLCQTQLSRHRPLALKSFAQHPVHGFYFSSQRHLRQAAKILKQNQIEPLEADVRTVDRYLMERFITSEAWISTHSLTSDKGFGHATNNKLKPFKRVDDQEPLPNLKTVSLDIETDYRGTQLLSIAVLSENKQHVFMIGSHPFASTDTPPTTLHANETALMRAFLDWIQNEDPDILIGWNCINFDLRFLAQVCKRLRIPFALGRNNEEPEWRVSPNNEQHYFTLIPGRVVLDGIDTLKSATYHFESFSLESVAREVLKKGKLIHDPDDRGQEILRLFHEDKAALARYNIEDCRLVWEIFERCDLINFAIERARLTGLPMDKVGGSVAAFENQYLPRLHRQGYVAPNIPDDPVGVGSPGGYVMNSRPGFYDNVLVLDFKSLYPSIIRSFQIDPYGLAEADHQLSEDLRLDDSDTQPYDTEHYAKGFRGAFFKKQDSILPTLIEHLWQARDKAKKNHNAALSQAIKIIMNSFYGVMGTPGCRFFDRRLPSSITLRGHEIMNQTRALIEQAGHQVIYGDTDSIFVWLEGKISAEQARVIGRTLAEEISHWWAQHLRNEYQLTSALELEFESHYTRFVMPTIRGSELGSKKRYAGLVCKDTFKPSEPNKDAYSLVFKGLETVRSDWTKLAREFQYALYERVFLNKAYKSFIVKTTLDIRAGIYDDKLVYRKRLRRKLSDYSCNIPPHAQAAKKADEKLTSQGKAARYERGGWISYCYTVNGPEPLEHLTSPLDYDMYLERQIAPIVDGIVTFLGDSYEDITSNQLRLL